jgi:hypothetical protein
VHFRGASGTALLHQASNYEPPNTCLIKLVPITGPACKMCIAPTLAFTKFCTNKVHPIHVRETLFFSD